MEKFKIDIDISHKEFLKNLNSKIKKSTFLSNLYYDIDYSEFRIIDANNIRIKRFPRFLNPFRSSGIIQLNLSDSEPKKIECKIEYYNYYGIAFILLFSSLFIASSILTYIISKEILKSLLFLTPSILMWIVMFLNIYINRNRQKRYCYKVINTIISETQ